MPDPKMASAKKQQARAPQRNFNKSRVIFLSVLVAISLFLLTLLLVIIPRGQVNDAFRGPEAFQASQSRDLDPNLARRSYPLADKLVFVSREELVCEDYQGRQIFASSLSMTRPSVQVMDGYLVVGDREGTELEVINPNGVVFKTSLDSSFVRAALNKDGQWAFLDEQSEDKALVHLVSPEGKRVLTLSFAKSGYPLNLKFTPDGLYLDVLILNTASSNMKTMVRRYDLEGGLVAQKVLEAYNSFFYGLEHDKAGLPIVYSPSQLVKLDFDQEENVLAVDLASIFAVYAQGKDLIILGNDQPDAYNGLYKYSAENGLEEVADQIGRVGHIRISPDHSKIAYVADNLLFGIDLTSLTVGSPQAMDGEILAYNFYANNEVNVVTSHSAHIVPWR